MDRGHGSPRKAFEELVEGATVHAISDGTWSLTDGLCEILRIVGKCDLAVSTWTAAQADLKRAERLLDSSEVKSLRLMVDRSFQTRQPGYCALARKLFGDDAIRVWVEPCQVCNLFRGQIRRPVPHEREHEPEQAARKSHGRRRWRAPPNSISTWSRNCLTSRRPGRRSVLAKKPRGGTWKPFTGPGPGRE